MKRTRLAPGKPPQRKTELRAKPKHPCGAVLPLLLPDETTDPKRICTCGSSKREWGTPRPALRRTEIRPVSRKRAAENRERAKVLAELAEQDPWCFARIDGVCTGLAQDGHELVRRSQGSSITDPEAIRGVCRPCHGHIGANPQWAVDHGLARWGMRTNPEAGEVA